MKPALHKKVEVNFSLQPVSPRLAQTELSTGYRRVCMCAYEEFFSFFSCFDSCVSMLSFHFKRRKGAHLIRHTALSIHVYVVYLFRCKCGRFVPFSIQDKHDATCDTAAIVKKVNDFHVV